MVLANSRQNDDTDNLIFHNKQVPIKNLYMFNVQQHRDLES